MQIVSNKSNKCALCKDEMQSQGLKEHTTKMFDQITFVVCLLGNDATQQNSDTVSFPFDSFIYLLDEEVEEVSSPMFAFFLRVFNR